MSAPYDILTALDRIKEIQESLTITSPRKERVRLVYDLHANRRETLNNLPCFMNTPRLHPTAFSPSLLQRVYTVRMQFFAGEISREASRVALAFEEKLVRALAADVTLNGACTQIANLRAADGTEGLGELEWARLVYSGLDYEVDVQFAEGQVYEP